MKLFSVIYTTPVGIEIFSKTQGAAKYGNPRVLVLYQGKWAASIRSGEPSDSREFQVV